MFFQYRNGFNIIIEKKKILQMKRRRKVQEFIVVDETFYSK